MFGLISEKQPSNSSKRVNNNDSSIPLLSDKKNDDNYERYFVKIKSGDTSEIEIDLSDLEAVDGSKLILSLTLTPTLTPTLL
jgi:hypothetical protein